MIRLCVILLVAAGLHTGASGQVARDVRTSTSTSGTVLDATATVNARRNRVLTTISASSSSLKLVRGQSIARFLRWERHVENRAAMLAMIVAVDKGKRVRKTIVIPNMSPAAGGSTPDESVKELAETLKIGDTVKFNYTMIGNRIYGSDILRPRQSPTKCADAPFVFISSRSVRTGKRIAMTVTANAGGVPCTFIVPEEVDLQGRRKPIAKIVDALKKFHRGDLLDIEYKTKDYKFIMTGAKAAECMTHGVLRRISYTNIRGYKHMVAAIKTPKGSVIRLVDPEAVIELDLRNAPDATADPPVQTALKTLKPKDFVIFKYRRQRGVCWLEGIYPASRMLAVKPAPANGTQ